MIQLRKTTKKDLDKLFLFQTDPDGIQMAAFTSKDPSDQAAYLEKWSKIVENPEVNMQTIWKEDQILGSIIHFDMMDETNVSYWIGKEFWGQGIASEAFSEFVKNSTKRPLFGRVAFDNIGSQKVLEKCGFRQIGKATEFANARNMPIEEYIYKLER